MLVTLIITASLLFLSYLIHFIVIKPIIGLKFYKNQGLQMTYFPILGNVKSCIDSQASSKDFYGHWKRQIQKNPKIQVIGGNFLDVPQLYLIEPKLIKEFYRKQENYVKIPMIVNLIKVMTGDGLIASEGETWKRHRKIIASAFHFDLLNDMIPDIVKIVDQGLDNFKSKDLNQINLTQDFEMIAGEVIGRLFFGEDFSEYRIQGKPVIYFLSELANRVGSQGPTLLYMIFGIKLIEWGMLPKYRKMLTDIRDYQNFAATVVEKKKKEARVKPRDLDRSRTLIDILISQEAANSEQSLSTQEISNEFMTFIGAGSATTGGIAARALYHLQENPQYKSKILEEVDKYFEDPSKVTLDVLNQMDFMTAFIKETLRVSPPLLGLLDRQAVKDHTLGDLKIKKGTVVNPGILLNNFNPAYHENEEVFYPERWLTNSKTRESINRDPFVFIPFSSGSRNCIGQHLAMNETKIILSLFLKKYNFELDPNYKHEMTQRINYEPLNVVNYKLECK